MTTKNQLNIVHVEPSVRNVADWPPPRITNALRLMFTGDYSQAGLLADAVLGDLRIQSILSVRSRSITALPVTFDHDSKRVRTALEEDFWKILPEQAAAKWMVRGLLGGACLAQIVWDTTGPRWIPKIKPWHLALQRYDVEKRQWFVRTAEGELPVTPGDGKWVLYAPGGEERPWEMALVRGLALVYAVKRYDLSDWSGFNEVHGGPIRVATGGANAEEVTRMAADLASLGGSPSFGLTAGRDVKLLEATSQSWRSFKEQIAWADTEAAIGVLGQNLTTEVSGGSLAASEVHERLRRDIMVADVQGLSTTLHLDVLRHWAGVNFGGVDTPWAVWDTTPPRDEEAEAKKFTAVAGAIKALEDLNIDTDAVLEQFGLRRRTQGGGGALRALAKQAKATSDAQAFLDVITDQAVAESRGGIAALTADLLEDVRAADSFDDLKSRLRARYRDASPAELADLLSRGYTLARLAGHLAVQEEVS